MSAFIKKHRTTAFLVAFIFVFILAGFICVDFVLRTNHNSNQMITQIAVTNTNTRAKDLTFSLEDHFTDLELLAKNASDFDDFEDPDLAVRLTRFGSFHGNSRLGIVSVDGITRDKNNEEISIADRDYFKKAMGGERAISKVVSSRYNKENSIILAVPIYRGRKVVGVLRNVYQDTQLDEVLHLSDISEAEHMFIVQTDGTIVLSGDNQEIGGTLGQVLETYLQRASVDSILQDLRDSFSGSGGFDFESEGTFYNCSYAPIARDHWYLYTITSVSQISDYTQNSSLNGIYFVVKVALLLLGIGAAIYLMIHSNQKKLREISRILEGVTNHAPGGVISFKPENGEFVFVNDGLYEMLGCSQEEFRKNYCNNFSCLICEEDRERTLADLKKDMESCKTSRIRYRVKTYDNKKFWVQQVSSLFIYKEYKIIYGMLMDIEEYKEFEDELYLSNQRYKILVNQREACFLEYQMDNMELLNCENFTEIFGRDIPGDISQNIRYLHQEDAELVTGRVELIRTGKASYSQCEARIANGQGQYLWCLIRFYILLDEEGLGRRLICKINNIDQRKRRAVDLENRAMKDPLTGLFNKVVTQEQIISHLKSEPENIQALFVLDIDNFKAINDKYGHDSGDQILLLMADTLRSLFRISDVVGRFGGDEFVVYMKDCFDETYALKKGEQLREEFYARCRRNGFTTSCSIGCALYPSHGTTWKELFKNADQALYDSKAKGRNCLTVYVS